MPYRPDTPERIANWEITREQWKDWELFAADSDGETFGRSQALNRAAALAGDWDAIVVADADLLLEDVAQAAAALDRARETEGYIVCYDTFYYLTEENSRPVRSGVVPTPRMAYYKLGGIWGGTFAVHRTVWDSVEGFDETIKSWGGEDGRFLRQIEDQGVFKNRVPGGVYHLKHPLVEGAR